MSETNLGAFRINPRGELNPNAKYKFLDAITYDGSSYLSINNDIIDGTAVVSKLPTDVDANEYFQVLARKGDKGDIADRYCGVMILNNTTWDYSQSDKVSIGTSYDISQPLVINNAYDGCIGMIFTNKDITLPNNSYKSIDYNYITLLSTSDLYAYSFICRNVNGTLKYYWNRSVYLNG